MAWSIIGWASWVLVACLILIGIKIIEWRKPWGLLSLVVYWALIDVVFLIGDWSKLHILWLFPIPFLILFIWACFEDDLIGLLKFVGGLSLGVVLIFGIYSYIERNAEDYRRNAEEEKAREKAGDEAASRVLDSLNLEVERILPVLDSHKPESAPVAIRGRSIVWYTGSNIEEFTDSKMRRSTGGMMSASLLELAKEDSQEPSQTPTLVILRGSIHETGMYRETGRIQGTRPLPPRSTELEEVRSYKLQVWLVDRRIMQVTGYGEIVPDPLPQAATLSVSGGVSGSIGVKVHNSLMFQLDAWLFSPYSRQSDASKSR